MTKEQNECIVKYSNYIDNCERLLATRDAVSEVWIKANYDSTHGMNQYCVATIPNRVWQRILDVVADEKLKIEKELTNF